MRTILATLHSKYIHNSLALPYLAAYCERDCGEILIREFTTHEPHESVLAMLLADEPDVIAFSVYLWNRRETLDLVDALAVARPQLKIVLGGPEISYDGHALFARHPSLTALVRGEGELPMRALLSAWQAGHEPEAIPRLALRAGTKVSEGPEGPDITDLDTIPSPFQRDLVDLENGFVYYETSRGCPFRCGFCLSARDNRVRSFSMERIRRDLALLMKNRVAKVKLVDRTFNYDAERARDIFAFILEHNQATHFHFEIAGHLLDDQTLDLLATVPSEMFQFEIGVQSTQENTLAIIDRQSNLEQLEANVRRLRQDQRVHLHLDLVAGLPNESYAGFLDSIDRVVAMDPHHLQIEPVKLLPGSPLREQAAEFGLKFEPNPPYTILTTPDLNFSDLQRLRHISRLLDLTYNAGCFAGFLKAITAVSHSFAKALEQLADFWQQQEWLRFPCNRTTVFERCWQFIQAKAPQSARQTLKDALAYDYARAERVIPSRVPEFFDIGLTAAEREWALDRVQERTRQIQGQGIRLQYFAAVFRDLPGRRGRTVRLFLYLTRSGEGMTVEETSYPSEVE